MSGHVSKDCRSNETNAFEADEAEPLSETGWFDLASIEMNALEIGSVQVSEEIRRLRIGIDSCAPVTVFPKTVAEDYPVLMTLGKAKSYRPASGELVPDLGARKVQVKLKDGSFRCVKSRVADTHTALIAVSDVNDMDHDVFFPRSEIERVNGVFELLVKLAPYKRTISKTNNTGPYSSLSAPERACKAVRLSKSRPSGSCRSSSFGGALRITRRQSQLESEPCEAGRNNPSRRHASTRLRMEEARLEPLSVGGETGSGDQSRAVTHPTLGPLGERPMVP